MSKILLTGVSDAARISILSHVKKLLSSGYFSRDDREDIIQELVLFYFEKLHKHKGQAHFDGLVIVSVRNKARNMLRDQRQRKISRHLPWEDYYDEMADNPSHLESVKDLESRYDFNKILRAASPSEKKILLLISEGFSLSEIARTERMAKKTIYKMLRKIEKK